MNLNKICKSLNLKEEDLIKYGDDVCKIKKINDKNNTNSKLILVTALTPTDSGEGKTTVSIGLTDSLNKLKHKAILNVRQPSLGPIFGMKGGASGCGKCSLTPKNRIDGQLTGDFNTITNINNLIASVVDNEIYFETDLHVDPEKVMFKRCVDICDRYLRNVTLNMTKKGKKLGHDCSFVITAASEIMSIFTLSTDKNNFKERVKNVTVAVSKEGKLLTVADLDIIDGLMTLTDELLYPNLVQTVCGSPVLIHSGPFANISTGTSSIISLKSALSLGDYVVTECGFGVDLGFEKYIDIISRVSNVNPSLVVLVVTVKAIKSHALNSETNVIRSGFENVVKCIEIIRKTNYNPIIAINKFDFDSNEDIEEVKKLCNENGVKCAVVTSFRDGDEGALELAKLAVEESKDIKPKHFYEESDEITVKIEKVARNVYGCSNVEYSEKALEDIKLIESLNLNLPYICIAKTQYSFSDDKSLKGRADNSTLHISKIEFNTGSGLFIPYAGKIFLMPALGENPRIKGGFKDYDCDEK